MASLFCPRCGDEVDSADGTKLCDPCYAETVETLDAPDDLVLRVCTVCGSYVEDGRWQSHDTAVPESELALRTVKGAVRAHVDASEVDIRLEPRSTDSGFEVACDYTAKLRGVPVAGELTVPVEVRRETCSTCSKMAGGYYESLVQVRADARVPTDDEVEFAREAAYAVAGKDYGDRDTFVSKVEEVAEGIDIYMSTNKAGLEVARRMTEEYGGSYSDSATLVGERDGEELYRVTYSVRLPEFVPDDIVDLDGDAVLVRRNDDVLKGVDLRTGDEVAYSDADGARKIGELDDAETTTLVSDASRPDEVKVLDPETYETVTVRRPRFVTQAQGEEVEAVNTDEGVFLVPT